MNNTVLGIATMNAGLKMPGSSLTTLLNLSHGIFDRIVIVDGDLDDRGKEVYSKYSGIEVLSNKWTGSLKAQYDLLLTKIHVGDWWMMLDDDEIPSQELLHLVHRLKYVPSTDKIKAIYTPRVTAFTEDGSKFYCGELIPTEQNSKGPGIAGPRAHIFKISEDLKMLHSPGGRHVVPYYTDPESSAYIFSNNIYHVHLKAPEMYVLNDCVKAIKDQDIKDKNINYEFRELMFSHHIDSMQDFIFHTMGRTVTRDFTDFCIKYKDRGAPEGRMFIWYYNICHPELNPFPAENWTYSLRKVLNDSWRKIYLENKAANTNRFVSEKITPYPKGIGEISL